MLLTENKNNTCKNFIGKPRKNKDADSWKILERFLSKYENPKISYFVQKKKQYDIINTFGNLFGITTDSVLKYSRSLIYYSWNKRYFFRRTNCDNENENKGQNITLNEIFDQE